MPPIKAMNVLIYAGNGTTVESVRHCLHSMRQLLSPHFAVSTVTADVLLKEPWMSTCALLIIPGGADLSYCKTFNGDGNRRISQYVRQGGSFIGFCAGGYYGSGKCEFEPEDRRLAVVGSRELAFFPGVCRGAAFSGFEYASENGARAPNLLIPAILKEEAYKFRCYFNGGGVFVDARKYKDQGVEILASYDDSLDVDGGDGKAAVVYCKFGEGRVILTGPHPEFAGPYLKKNEGASYTKVVEAIMEDDESRIKFLKAMLDKLGLQVSEIDSPPPRLSRVHLTSIHSPDVRHLVDRLKVITTVENSINKIIDEGDVFILEEGSLDGSSVFSTKDMVEALSEDDGEDGIIDYNKILKYLQFHDSALPSAEVTPFFNHASFYESLLIYRSQSRSSPSQFGSFLLYGETVTSTNTMLDKNPKLLQSLPNGLTFAATTQVAGRGRGSNVWVSPKGCMIFSTVIHHAQELNTTSPVIFVQYLVGLAVVEGIKNYEPGYTDMPVFLKWPNDIYARDPTSVTESFVKIGGILVNSSYSGNDFHLVVGVGINTHNTAPTTSLSLLLEILNNSRVSRGLPKLSGFTQEKLLARVLVTFEEIYYRFCIAGWKVLEQDYYKHWLHTGQVVTLEMEDGAKARVVGVTRDWGLLKAEELGVDGRITGRVFTLMSDGNSFDFFRGLLKRKS